jgi:CheY-like chemotaxis protein
VRVLLVEDFSDLAEATADILSDEGLTVRTALSGREALELAPSFHPQLVLCDLSLPDMKGLEVVRELRLRPSTARSYIVILTAMEKQELIRSESKPLGIDMFISKPITIQAIRTLIEVVRQREGNTHL